MSANWTYEPDEARYRALLRVLFAPESSEQAPDTDRGEAA